MKHFASLTVLAAAFLMLPACSSHRALGPSAGQLSLAMVTDVGGLGDKSFNDSAYRGLLQAKTDLGAFVQVLQSRSAADYEPNLAALTNRHPSMIYAIGFLMNADLDQIAKQNPKQRYAIVDAVVDEPNVVSATFKEEDGSFLAGALAALVSKTHHIAFLGGQDIPLLRKFEAGFSAGAREVDPNTRVDVKYVDSFVDVAAGQELANVLYSGGADVIFAAAGKAGLGAINAAKARSGAYVIGVDSDQDGLAPGKILTSMVKHVDVAVLDIARGVKNGKTPSGHLVLGLKEHAVGLTDFAYTKKTIGDKTLARIAVLRNAIVSGKIVPPSTRQALAAFTPVKI